MSTLRVLQVVSVDDASASQPGNLRKDFAVLAEKLGATTLDRSQVRRSPYLRRLAGWCGIAPWQAFLAFRERDRYDVILTDGEHIGLPLALMLKAARSEVGHVTIGHRITAPKKRVLFRRLKAYTHFSRIALHSQQQYELAVKELGIPADRLALVPYQVDVDFWQPLPVPEERLICSAGLEFRDYPTLTKAVRDLDVQVVIGAASHWSRRNNTAADAELPPNVEVSAFDYPALRQLYARSAIVVVPLQDVDFQAGITVILEAMAMGKPLIVTHTVGQTDIVQDRRTATRGAELRVRQPSFLRTFADEAGVPLEPNGFYVAPEDTAALRKSIVYLLDHPEVRHALGMAARRTVERLMSVDHFAERMSELVRGASRREVMPRGRGVSALSPYT